MEQQVQVVMILEVRNQIFVKLIIIVWKEIKHKEEHFQGQIKLRLV
jgi:hypothetical protein